MLVKSMPFLRGQLVHLRRERVVSAQAAPELGAEAFLEEDDHVEAWAGGVAGRELARTIGMMAPNSTVKLDITRQDQEKTVSLTLAEMPNEHVAKADSEQAQPTSGVPHLGLSVAPAADVSGAGGKGVVVTAVDPDGPAAEHGLQEGNVILDVGGKPVANAGDVRKALTEAKAQGKHDVLVRVKIGDATRFVALPLGNA